MKWLIPGLVLFATQALAETTEFVGIAYQLDGDQRLYEEHHRLTLNQGQPESEVVRYLSPNGQLVAEKRMRYRELARPGYRIELRRDGRSESVRPDDDGVAVDSRDSGRLAWPQQAAVIDGGFHYFVLQHFDALVAGDSLDFQFLTPSRLSWTPLNIKATSVSEQRLELRLSLQNPVLRWLVDPIELSYSRPERRLLEYRGLTNLPNGEEGNYRARIEYRYAEEAS